MEEGRSAVKILTGVPAGKRRLGRSRHRREDNIRMEGEWTRRWNECLQEACPANVESVLHTHLNTTLAVAETRPFGEFGTLLHFILIQ